VKRSVMRGATLDLVSYDATRVMRNVECVVRVGDTGLAIEAPHLAFRAHGFRVSAGHFMMMTSDGRIGSLHRYPGGRTFEGWWRREREQGFWRICASPPPGSGGEPSHRSSVT
jgi:hypothetical protein